MKATELFAAATLNVSKPEQLSRTDLLTILKKFTFAIIRGVNNAPEIIRAKNLLKSKFSHANDHPGRGESPKAVQNNFQKFAVGGAMRSATEAPKCLRTFYNPLWADDIFGMREIFRRTAQVRNILFDFSLNFATDHVENGFWTAARIHQYPRGGGFMSAHIDDYIPTLTEKSGVIDYYQPVIMMSKRGADADCDFTSGGGFFEYENERYFYEAECQLGDIIIYDGRTVHGVTDIDPLERFEQTSAEGRYAGFVTMYKQF